MKEVSNSWIAERKSIKQPKKNSIKQIKRIKKEQVSRKGVKVFKRNTDKCIH